jgi:hypothetical protein
MEYSPQNAEASFISQSLVASHRPPHPNPALKAEFLAPLIKEQANEAIREMEKLLTSSAIGPVMITTVVQGSHSHAVAADREEQETKRIIRLNLISQLEAAKIEIAVLPSAESSDTIKFWQKIISPLIDQLLTLSKNSESQTTDELKRIHGHFVNLTTELSDDIESDTDATVNLPDNQSGPDFMQRLASLASDTNRQNKRKERNILSALLYDPYSQLEECRLNELAISMKQRGYEIEMDPRDPVICLGDDDIRLLSIFVGNTFKEWARTISERFVADLIDPISSLTIPDQDTLYEHCAAITASQRIIFKITGVHSLDFSMTVPNSLAHSLEDLCKEIDKALTPIEGFEKTLGFNHTIEEEHSENGLKVTLRVVLPKTDSRYEPDSFRLKELALERLADINPAEILSHLEKLTETDDNVTFSATENELESQEKEDIMLWAAGGISLLIQGTLFNELSAETTLDVIRLATQLAEHQPSTRYISLSKPTEHFFKKPQNVQDKIVLQLKGDPPGTAAPLSLAREMLEKQRSAFDSTHPMEMLMTLKSMRHRPIIGGDFSIEEISTIRERLKQLPDWIGCEAADLRLLTQKEKSFSILIETIQQIKEHHKTSSVYVTQVPAPKSPLNRGKSISFALYSETEIPLAHVHLDSSNAEVSVVHFDTALLEDLRSRVHAAIINPQEGQLRRIRDIDQQLMAAGVDLSPPLIQELTVLSNSWAGRELPAERVGDIIFQYIFDDAYTIDRKGDTIRYLHLSERFEAIDTLADSGGSKSLPN